MQIKLNHIVLTIALVLAAGCTPSEKTTQSIQTLNQSSIINGVDVPADNELGQSTVGLMLQYNGTWYQACSGSIIAKNMILTAAHCVSYVNANYDNIVISFSANTFDNDIQKNPETAITDVRSVFNTIDISGLTTHPDYSRGNVDYDIAILRLKKDIPSTHKPVELLPSEYMDPSGLKLTLDEETHNVTLLGFGVTAESPFKNTTYLKMTTVPAKFEKSILVTDQTHGTGACHGDSGGPAFIELNNKNYLVGVTHGPHAGSTTCHEYGDYLNPNFFVDFIQKTILDLNSK